MILRDSIPISFIFSSMKRKLIGVLILGGYLSYADEHLTDWFGVEFPLMPLSVPVMLGTVITLVLSFKMAQSYDRWWEARKVWGGIVNDSRSLIREVSNLMAKDVDAEKAKKYKNDTIRYLLGWIYLLVGEMRELGVTDDVRKYFSSEELEELRSIDNNLSTAALFKIESFLQSAYQDNLVNDFQQVRIAETINNLCDSMGKSERLKKTVFPVLYTKLIEYTIWVFAFLLPLAFRDPNKWLEFPIVSVISVVFFSLENLALGLQDPFENRPTDIPISSIARNIEIHGLKVLGSKDVPEPFEAKKYYMM